MYLIGGVEYPSVTTVCGVINKQFLMAWAAKQEREHVLDAAANMYETIRTDSSRMVNDAGFRRALSASLGARRHQQITREAARIGTEAHAGIERICRERGGLPVEGDPPTLSVEAGVAVAAFEVWADRVDLRPELVEQVVWSTAHRYAGTLDLVARVRGGHRLLIDFKTSRRVYPEHELQAAMYQVALRERGQAVDGALVLRLPKTPVTGTAVEHTVPPAEELWPACEAALTLYRWKRDRAA